MMRAASSVPLPGAVVIMRMTFAGYDCDWALAKLLTPSKTQNPIRTKRFKIICRSQTRSVAVIVTAVTAPVDAINLE